jgi:dTDP-L-rhamnose 4-epimerase
MSESILVTGGAGFIGSHLVDALIQDGHRVRVLDSLEPQVHGALRTQGKLPAYCNRGAEYLVGDVRDRALLERALEGIDMVFHEAAAVGVGQSMYEIEKYVGMNTYATAVLLDVLANRHVPVRKLIVASSMSIYGEGAYQCERDGCVYPRLRRNDQLARHEWEMRCPACGQIVQPILTDEEKPLYSTSIYAISKKDQEEMCLCIGRAYNIPTVALRYFNVYGARQALSNPYTGVAAIFSSRLLNDHAPFIFEDGLQSRDFVHVSDIVQVNLLAMKSDAANYDYFNVGTGRPTTVRDVASGLSRALGKTIEPQIVGKFREGDIRHCVADIAKARHVLGYTPHISFEDGMRGLTDWVRRQDAQDRVDAAASELEQRGLTR